MRETRDVHTIVKRRGDAPEQFFEAEAAGLAWLAAAGGALGLLFAYLAIPVIQQLGADSIPRVADVTVNMRVLAFAAAVTLLTGSIFPAIVWHALNNASALIPAHLGWVPADGAVEPWTYGAAAAGLALAFLILWRVRSPYPGLRTDPLPSEGARLVRV